jgi:acetyl/propionyl-CoA carboxylase alpha subunit
MSRPFKKVLVANRGEIAVRVMRALKELGTPSVAIYSEADRLALHVRMADEAWPVGPAPSRDSYLKVENVLAAAKAFGADAIHPGYGFLSENADFARKCVEAGITFIGPPPEAITMMGNKVVAREAARKAGAPVVPGATAPWRTKPRPSRWPPASATRSCSRRRPAAAARGCASSGAKRSSEARCRS